MTAADRLLDRRGEDVTVYTYTYDTTDSYGDPTYIETATSTVGIVEQVGGVAEIVRSPEGEEIDIELAVFLKDDVTVHEPSADNRKPSVIERALDGEQYRVEAVTVQDNGFQRCNCARKHD